MKDPHNTLLLGRTVRRAWRAFKRGWSRTSRQVKRQWLFRLIATVVLVSAATLAGVYFVHGLEQRGALAWEMPLLQGISKSKAFSFNTSMWIESPGNGVFLWPVIILLTGLAAMNRRPLLALTWLFGFAFLDAFVVLGWLIWKRDRPPIENSLAHPGGMFSSFPSGHMSQTVFVYGLLLLGWARATRSPFERVIAFFAFIVITGAVGMSRLRLGAHWPTDVIGGIVLGLLWMVGLVWALPDEDERHVTG